MNKTWISILQDTASRFPNKIACWDENRQLTFAQLNSSSIGVSNEIIKYTSPHEPVIIILEKGCTSLVALWATIYSQCFYVFIETTYPIARKKAMIEQLEGKLIITTQKYKTELESISYNGVIILEDEILNYNDDQTSSLLINEDEYFDLQPIYAMFTSGSTGTPKCILLQHRGVLDFICEFVKEFKIDDTDIIANQAPFDFDVSVKDIFTSVYTGATIYFVPKRHFSFPAELVDFLYNNKITILTWAVSALCIVSKAGLLDENKLIYLKKILFSGEIMPMEQINLWFKYCKNACFFNVYGPSEITCNCTYHKVLIEDLQRDVLPIGNSFKNKPVFLCKNSKLIDKTLPYELGEIMVLGNGIGLGYYNDEERTQQSFIQNPLHNKYLDKVYATGDYGYYNEEGLLFYSGRKDHQIKRMGQRIELGELESVLLGIENVKDVCCIYKKENDCLCAFYVSDVMDLKQMRQVVLRELPRFMLPTKFVKKEKLPLNKNGKIDRTLLLSEL